MVDEAVQALLSSATHDVDRLYPRPAIEQVARALSIGDCQLDGSTRRSLVLTRAAAWVELRQFPEAEADLQAVVDEAEAEGDRGCLARARAVRAEIARLTGRYEDARTELAAAAVLLEDLGAGHELAGVQRAWGMNSIFAGDFEDAEVHLDVAEALYDAEGDRRGGAWVDQHRAWVSFVRGDVDAADARLTAAASTLKEMGDRGGVAWALGLLAYVRLFQGRFAEAEDLGRLVVEEAAERGDQWAEAMLMTLQALLALWGGRIDEAARRAGEAQRIFRVIGDRYGEIQAATTIARTLAAQGLSVDALRTAEEAVGLATPIGQGTLAQSVTASVAMYAGQSSRAIAHAHLALDAPDVPPGFGYDALVTLALAHLQQGEVDEAMTYAEQAVAVRPDHPNGTQCLALVTAATGRPEEAARLARTVGPMTAATYLDRFFAGVALALAEAQLGKGQDTLDALEALDALIATIDDAAVPVLAELARVRGPHRHRRRRAARRRRRPRPTVGPMSSTSTPARGRSRSGSRPGAGTPTSSTCPRSPRCPRDHRPPRGAARAGRAPRHHARRDLARQRRPAPPPRAGPPAGGRAPARRGRSRPRARPPRSPPGSTTTWSTPCPRGPPIPASRRPTGPRWPSPSSSSWTATASPTPRSRSCVTRSATRRTVGFLIALALFDGFSRAATVLRGF